MDTKPWYQSRTVWLNTAAFVIAVLELLSAQPWIPPSVIPVIGSVVAVCNVYLRMTTDSKLTK